MRTEQLQRAAYLLIIIVLGVVVLNYGQGLVFLILFPAILSFLLLPLCRRLEKLRLPRWLSVTLSCLSLVVVLSGVMLLMGNQFMSFKEDLPALEKRVNAKVQSALSTIESEFHVTSREQVIWLQDQVAKLSKTGTRLVLDLFSWTGSFLSNLVLVLIILFLMLLLRSRFKEFLRRLSDGRDVPLLQIVDDISQLALKYSKGVALVILILAVLNSVGFLIIGLKHAVLLGVTSAMLTIIPYVGTLIGGLLPLTVALITKDSMAYPLAVMGVVGLSQFLEGNFITPKIVGSSVSLNPLASILALVSGGMLWGIAGMVLAIPIMGMLKVVCDAVPELQPYGYLLGEESNRGWRKKVKEPE
jgi:predicted PurR-regulated permease PerM